MECLKDIVIDLDLDLRTTEIPDYPQALNGLQLENRSGQVGRVFAAVDASLPVIEKCLATEGSGPALLLVHHGLFWSGAQRYVDSAFRKLEVAMAGELAIYSNHIPLDVHPVWGNNARLVEEIGLLGVEPFFDWKGIQLGLRGEFRGSRDQLREKVATAVGGAVHLCPGGDEQAGTVGVITGGAGSEVKAICDAGIDSFVTGEGPHWSFPMAEEIGLNVFYGGHYATETFGVKALAEHLKESRGLPWQFIDHPTGL